MSEVVKKNGRKNTLSMLLDNNSFIQTMTANNLIQLPLPVTISRQLPSTKGVELIVTIKDDPDADRRWFVKTHYTTKRKRKNSANTQGHHQLSTGWGAFTDDYQVKVQDALHIELLLVNEQHHLRISKVPTAATTTTTTTTDETHQHQPDDMRPTPPRLYHTRSRGFPVHSPSPRETIYCHSSKRYMPKHECSKCPQCSRHFHSPTLSRKDISILKRTPELWMCPACSGKCQCKDCFGKLNFNDFKFLRDSSPPPSSPPPHVSVSVVDMREDLMSARDYIDEHEKMFKEQKTKYNKTLANIKDLLALLGREEEASKLLGYQEEEEEEQEEEAAATTTTTMVEDSVHPIVLPLHNQKEKCGLIIDQFRILREAAKNGTAVFDVLEQYRRDLTNKYLDKRGHIRVFCRVRPPLTSPSKVFKLKDEKTVTLIQGEGKQETPYEFDIVFGKDATQEDVYLEIKLLVDSVISGKKVCIFCYGRSGSGKTFTMFGKKRKGRSIIPETKGIIPRAIDQLYDAKCSSGGDMEFSIEWHQVLAKKEKLLLKACSSKDYNKEKMFELVGEAFDKRDTQETKQNKTSSRTHAIMEINIVSPSSTGSLCLVDLAGNEMPDGDTASIGVLINKDLVELEIVLTNHATDPKLPIFRGCELNRRLMPFLSGESNTLTIIHIDHEAKYGDTSKTLKFGNEALLRKVLQKKRENPKEASTETQTQTDHESPIPQQFPQNIDYKPIRRLIENALKDCDQ